VSADHALTLRLLARRGRVVTTRRGVIAAAARARRGGRTYTLWPDARQPMISADMGYPPAAEWLRRTMVPTLRRLPDAATWMSLRARAALIAEGEGLAVEVGARVAATAAPLRIALFSPSGQAVSKVVCFMLPEGEDQPRIVVKAIAEPRFSARLRAESALLEAIRTRIRHDPAVARTLPPAPLFAGEAAGEFVLAEPFDALGSATGSGTLGRAIEWLRGFQAASFAGERRWDEEDERAAVRATQNAWRLARLPDEDAVVARNRTLLAPLRGTLVPRCAVHGDFWRHNVAAADGEVRVYDWEWARLDGTPVFDLWTYDLAELRERAREGEGQGSLERHLETALGRVRGELRQRGLDDRLALATLPPVLGALSFRVRTRLAMPDEMERHSIAVMRAAERLLLAS
jgi:Phosphotransferase enzyme family